MDSKTSKQETVADFTCNGGSLEIKTRLLNCPMPNHSHLEVKILSRLQLGRTMPFYTKIDINYIIYCTMD